MPFLLIDALVYDFILPLSILSPTCIAAIVLKNLSLGIVAN
jgi:hypothetical protein